jgi:hypothetical protein
MIDFVFVHIPKTGGTSISAALGIWPSHVTARDLRLDPDSSGKFSFAFVRNPWDRIVSYAHSLRGRKKKNVWHQPDRLVLRPQVDYIMDEAGQPLVDFIGRFERLTEGFEMICDRIGIPTPDLPHLNRAAHRQHYRDYLDERARETIAEKYAEDIARFGYSF